MKRFLFLLVATICFAFSSCQDYEPFSYSDVVNGKYQQYKFDCVGPEMALSTNYYGMGPSAETRSTDGGSYQKWNDIYTAYKNHPLTEAEPLGNAWWVLLENTNITCTMNYHGQDDNGRVDMTGFNSGDQPGKTVYLTISEQNPNCSNCSNNSQHKHDYYKKYWTDGLYLFVEIHAKSYPNGDGANPVDVICKVYATYAFNPVKSYLLCFEDLGGKNLDFNDCVIVGGQNMKPRIIYRMAAYPMDITADNQTYHLDANMFGDYDIELPFNNMNTPNSWSNATITANGVTIKVLLSSIADMPAVIATDISYKFHREEDTMTSAEFSSIPFFK